jgi:hypothetical protein
MGECPICKDPLTGVVKKLPCGHLLHTQCERPLRQYEGVKECPLCRGQYEQKELRTYVVPPPPDTRPKVSYADLVKRAEEELGQENSDLVPNINDTNALKAYLRPGEVVGGSIKKRVTRRGRKLVVTRRRRGSRRKLDRLRSSRRR